MAEEKVTNIALTDVITTAIKLPGVKVDREAFLREQFKGYDKSELEWIINAGPVEAQCGQEELMRLAQKLVKQRTLTSTGASFMAGLPGGLAMAVTIPADVVQFYGVALRMAQELAYLYGEGDLWQGGELDDERVTNQLMLYCGVMLGVTGATQLVRLMSSALAKQALKKLPQKALTKGIVYPVVKSVAKFFGVRMTKSIFAKGISKAVPIIGGVVSGGMTLASMRPMGMRLVNALDEAHFSYTEVEMQADWAAVREVSEEVGKEETADIPVNIEVEDVGKPVAPAVDAVVKIEQAQKLRDAGVLTDAEFDAIKQRIISEM